MIIRRKTYNALIDELSHLKSQAKQMEHIINNYRSVSELTTQIDDMQKQIDELTAERNRLQKIVSSIEESFPDLVLSSINKGGNYG